MEPPSRRSGNRQIGSGGASVTVQRCLARGEGIRAFGREFGGERLRSCTYLANAVCILPKALLMYCKYVGRAMSVVSQAGRILSNLVPHVSPGVLYSQLTKVIYSITQQHE